MEQQWKEDVHGEVKEEQQWKTAKRSIARCTPSIQETTSESDFVNLNNDVVLVGLFHRCGTRRQFVLL